MRRCGDAALTQECNPREREGGEPPPPLSSPSTFRSRHGERATEVEMPRGEKRLEPAWSDDERWGAAKLRNGGEARQFRLESSVFQIRSITQEYSSACRSLGASRPLSFCPPPQRHARAGWAGLGCGISALSARWSASPSLVLSAKPLARSRRCVRAVARHRHLACTLARWQGSFAKRQRQRQKQKRTDALYARRVAGMA